MVASAMQRKFSRTASLSQSSSRSGSLSDISCDGEQLDIDESPTHRQQKYTQYVHNFMHSFLVPFARNKQFWNTYSDAVHPIALV